MLRLGGLLSSEHNTVTRVLASAKSIIADVELLEDVEAALDSMAKNSDNLGTVFDSLHAGVNGGALKGSQLSMQGKSLGIFSAKSQLRQTIDKVVHSQCFEVFVLVCIFINLIILVAYSNVQRHDSESDALDYLDGMNNILGAMFTLEMFMRIIARGFVNGKHTYLQDWFNRFDFAIILVRIVGNSQY